MILCAFFRKEGFYFVEANDINHAIEMAIHNKGTIKVEDAATGKLIWPKPEHKQ